MDLKINREMLIVSESIFDGIQEQSVELDYILPDYFPDIFKLVKCCIVPSVLSYSINGDTVSYELQADIKILYCSEQSNTLQCICQKMTFNKSIQLSETAEKPSVTLVPKTDHINCRVVNQRRIDMRGAVSIKIKITGERTQEVICDIFGMNAQMKKLPVEFAAKKISAFKSISASEDFELNSSNQPVISIIRTYSVINVTDKKIVANKLVLKGEASVCVLYSCENGLESMKFPVPFSQIVDMDGLDESFTCSVKAETASCDVTASADSNGDARILKCELRINVSCSAVKNLPAELVTDVYSTSFPCEFASSRLKIEQAPVEINELIQEKLTIESENGNMVVEYVLCLGIALIVSSLTVYLRDLQYILGIFVMALQYMTPVMYGVDMVENSGAGDWLILIFNLNPMTPIIKIYRQIIYYGQVPELGSLALALIIGIVFIVVGEVLFKKLQRGFAEEF